MHFFLLFLLIPLFLAADHKERVVRDKPDLYEKNRNAKEEEDIEKRRYYLNYNVHEDEERCEQNEDCRY